MKGSAIISPCGHYRYALTRSWEPSKGALVFVMLNPSTADAQGDDPTLRRCIEFTKAFGFGELRVVNLFAWRSSDPKALPADKSLAVGPLNDDAILHTLQGAVQTICAWGTGGGLFGRDKEVLALIRRTHSPHCLHLTKGGFPSHPLYLKKTCRPGLYFRA